MFHPGFFGPFIGNYSNTPNFGAEALDPDLPVRKAQSGEVIIFPRSAQLLPGTRAWVLFEYWGVKTQWGSRFSGGHLGFGAREFFFGTHVGNSLGWEGPKCVRDKPGGPQNGSRFPVLGRNKKGESGERQGVPPGEKKPGGSPQKAGEFSAGQFVRHFVGGNTSLLQKVWGEKSLHPQNVVPQKGV